MTGAGAGAGAGRVAGTLRADVAVLGGGTAGAVVAASLVERTGASVLLVEAGPDYGAHADGRWPADLLDPLTLPQSHDWGYRSGTLPGSRTLPFERARVIGGCSAHNGCSQTAGPRADYDAWGLDGAGAGAERFERRLRDAAERMRVRHYRDDELTPLQRAALDGLLAQGVPRTDDLLDLDGGVGCGPSPVNVAHGVRWNAAFSHLDDVRGTARLRVLADAHVDRVELAGARVLRAHVLRDGTATTIEADRFVLCAGAYGSPAVLLRSGVGAPGELRALGIEPLLALPGVGRNLHDHPTAELRFAGSERLARELAAFGPAPEEQVIAKLRSPGADGPFDLHLFPWASREAGRWVCHLPAGCLTPRSRGALTLRSVDPLAAPLLDHAFLADDEGADLAALRHGLERARELVASPALAPLLGEPLDALSAGTETGDDAIRRGVAHYWHPAGTCALGPDPAAGAVVDPRGRLHGCDNLWVADASIFPAVPRATPNLSVVVLAAHVAEAVA